MATGGRDLLQLLANPSNREILALLAVEPQYPRRLAELVGLSEDEASRRLRSLEKLGLVEAAWANVGRNVRLYRLSASRFQVQIGSSGLTVSGLGESDSEPLALGRAAEAPPELPRFVGRDRETKDLQDLLARQKAACITGLGGAGKTGLAATVARRWPAAVLWHTLSPGESGPLLLARLAAGQRDLDRSERGHLLAQLSGAEDPHRLEAALLASVNALGTLVVLDRCEVAGEGAMEVAARLVLGLDKGRLLATSRSYPPGLPRNQVATFRLEGLSLEETSSLIRSLGPEGGGSPVDSRHLAALHARTGGHVLSVLLLAQAGTPLSAPGRPDPESGVRGFLVDELLPQLSDTEREVLMALSVLRQPFLADEAEAITGHRHTGHALLRLEARSLVGRAGDRFFIHDLVRSFASEVVPDRAGVHRRAARTLAASGEATRVLEALHHHLEARDTAAALAVVGEEAARRTFRFADLALGPPYREILERLAASALPQRERALVELELAELATLRGDPQAAERHLAVARAGPGLAEPRLATRLALADAHLLRLRGQGDEAAVRYGDAQRHAAEAGDDTLLLEALVEASFNEEERDSGNAFRILERALEVAASTDDLRLLSLVYAGLSRLAAHHLDPRFQEWSEEAMRLARLAGYLRGEASVYMAVTSHHIMHDEPGAEEWAVRYLDIANRLNDPWIRACALSDMAFMESRRLRYEAALMYAEDCLRLARSIRSPFYEIGALVVIAEVLVHQGRPEEALVRARSLLDGNEGRLPVLVARLGRAAAAACRQLGDEAGALAFEARAAEVLQGRPARDVPGPVHLAVPPAAAATPPRAAPPSMAPATPARKPSRGGP